MQIGFIGLGIMGVPMSKNILKKGFSLTVYNRTDGKADELVSLGAEVAHTPKELAEKSDVIITMVTAGEDVKDVLFGENGVIKGAKPGTIVIDMSTIGVKAVIEIADELEKYKIKFVDAPVTGSLPKAISGELTIMIGGDEDVVEKVRPVLMSMGQNLLYIGPSGSGQAIKLVNNFLIASTISSLSEGVKLAKTVNLSEEKILEMLPKLPCMSDMMKLKLPNFVKEDYPLFFTVSNMLKDIQLASGELNGDIPDYLKLTIEKFQKACDQGLTNEDFSTIAKVR